MTVYPGVFGLCPEISKMTTLVQRHFAGQNCKSIQVVLARISWLKQRNFAFYLLNEIAESSS